MEDDMGKILCPTRGGKDSRRTQDAAIAMARQQGDDLVFLYVVDLDFLNKTERAVRPDVVAEEMRHLGEFLLSMAQERAQKQGVDASYVVREGGLQAEIKASAVEVGATLVVLGQSEQDDPTRKFEPEKLFKFAEQIEADTGIEVRVVC
jgi:nucleotide-binding universal stress UspA family protein